MREGVSKINLNFINACSTIFLLFRLNNSCSGVSVYRLLGVVMEYLTAATTATNVPLLIQQRQEYTQLWFSQQKYSSPEPCDN